MTTQAFSFSQVMASGVQDMNSSLSMLLSTLESISVDLQNMDDEQRQNHATLHYEAARINTELFQLQLLHKWDNDDLVPQIDEYYLCDIFKEQLASCDALLQIRGITIDLQCEEDFSWYFDAQLISSIIYKTLVNCSRYCRGKIQLKAYEKDGCLHVDISDDGNGYPKFMIEQSQISQLPEQFTSTQLDFFCSRQVVELHHKQKESGHLHIANGGAYDGGLVQIVLP